jgi:hypothetical protein
MSDIAQITKKESHFIGIYSKSRALVAAIFLMSNLIDEKEILRTKIRNLALNLVSMSVELKDIISDHSNNKTIGDLEKCSLELMSLLDVASLSGLLSKMNADILKEEFQNFNIELGKFWEKFESEKINVVKEAFTGSAPVFPLVSDPNLLKHDNPTISHPLHLNEGKKPSVAEPSNGNGYRRKDLRKNTILNFIKGHNNASIKDIVPHVVGCSEKTIQREIIELRIHYFF